jgi:hypothetical protein
MTFKTTVKDKAGKPIQDAIVIACVETTGEVFVRGTDGNGYADVAMIGVLANPPVTLTVQAPGYKNSIQYLIITSADQYIEVTLDSFNHPLWRPTQEEVDHYRGAFCIPDAFLDHSDQYGDNVRIWTPALLAYDDERQDIIIDRYLQFYPEKSHFVINLGGSTYHNDYPHIDDNPSVARKAIIKLLNKKLIPICCATDDENPDVVLESYKTNSDIIDDAFIMWEMNGPCQGDSDRMFAITQKTCEANPRIHPKLHFTAGHGSMGEPEGEWWKRCAEIGIGGLFSQDDHWDDVEHTAEGLEDTAAHLHGQRPGWEGLNLINVAFEQTTTPVYHKYPDWDGLRQRAFGDYLLAHCPSIVGVMDGHSYGL